MTAQTPQWLLLRVPSQPPDVTLPSVLWRHRWLMIIALGIAAAAAAFYLRHATPLYTSSSRLFIQPYAPRVMGGAETGGYSEASAYFLNNEKAVLLSSPVLNDAVDRVRARNLRFLSKIENPSDFLKEQFQVITGRREDTLTVSLDTPNPHEGQVLVSAIVDSYIAHQTQDKHGTAAELLRAVEKESQDCDRQIAKTSTAILALKKSGGILSIDTRTLSTRDLEERLKEAVLSASLDAASADANYKAALAAWPQDPQHQLLLQQAEQNGSMMISSDAEAAQARHSILELQQKIDDGRHLSGFNHPQVRALQEEMDDRRAGYVVATRRWRDATANRQQMYQIALDQQKEATADLAEKFSNLEMLTDEMSRLEKRSEALSSRVRELQAEEMTGSLNIKLLDPASLPTKPSKPNPTIVWTLSMLCAVVLVVTIGYWHERARRMNVASQPALATPSISVIDLLPRLSGTEPEQYPELPSVPHTNGDVHTNGDLHTNGDIHTNGDAYTNGNVRTASAAD